MNKLTIVVLVIFLVSACQTNKENKVDYAVISGGISNFYTDKIIIQDVMNKPVDTIQIDSLHKFVDTLKVRGGYYKIKFGPQYTWTYLKPGYKLHIKVDNNRFDESLTYTGEGSDVNNYLAKRMLTEIALRPKLSYKNYGQLDEKNMLKLMDSIQNVLNQTLEQAHLKDADFIALEKKHNMLKKANVLNQYEMVKRYFTHNEKYKNSPDFPDPMLGIDINDPKMMKVPGFSQSVEGYLQYKLAQKEQTNDFDPILPMQMIEKTLSNPELQEELAYNNAKFNLLYTKDLNQFYALFNKMVKNPEYKKEIKKKYDLIKEMVRGKDSPDFTAYDINLKKYHLKDFAGKPLYIDLWATWCGPCRAEIPFLDKIKEAYKNKPITFLSLDVYDDAGKWAAMVEGQKMSGWQLMSPDRDMPFLKKYVVDGIPRFILLDKNGKIIDANAPRPSEQELIKLLDKTLSENGKN